MVEGQIGGCSTCKIGATVSGGQRKTQPPGGKGVQKLCATAWAIGIAEGFVEEKKSESCTARGEFDLVERGARLSLEPLPGATQKRHVNLQRCSYDGSVSAASRLE